jgi:CRISPR-associated protein Cmr6
MNSGFSKLANLKAQLEVAEGKPTSKQKTPKPPRTKIQFPEIPMMYRAQIAGRCGLQYAGDDSDLDTWTDEWLQPKAGDKQPKYQYQLPKENLKIFRCKIDFPYRLFTNGGQDSIHRPTFGKQGIPIFPGSSLKGMFRRACREIAPDKLALYCGDAEQPGCLRFHAAYPIGDWAATEERKFQEKGQPCTKICYRINDLVHPQQERQLGRNNNQDGGKASPTISLYKPQLSVEISCTRSDVEVDWQEVEKILREAVRRGVGGKTNSGYGVSGSVNGKEARSRLNHYDFVIPLQGKGTASKLLNELTEFRPQLFKAALRGHASRLLSGVCNDEAAIDKHIACLFGGTDRAAAVTIDFDWQPDNYRVDTSQMVSTYSIEGDLKIATSTSDRAFIETVLKFAYTMGGFGKTWRRVWHKDFYKPTDGKTYNKAIGCHWTSSDLPWNSPTTTTELTEFLNDAYEKSCARYDAYEKSCARLGTRPPRLTSWREAWHPDNVQVFAKVTRPSQVIALFHESQFKFTPAIGGKKNGDSRPKNVSSVWHRMLPINGNQYLEIVTVFKKGNWQNEQDMRSVFIQRLTGFGFEEVVWGKEQNQPD